MVKSRELKGGYPIAQPRTVAFFPLSCGLRIFILEFVKYRSNPDIRMWKIIKMPAAEVIP